MPRVDLKLSTPIERTTRVQQVEGMFDVPDRAHAEFTVELDLPLEAQDWQIGLVTGPSGSGKSTLARELWPELIDRRHDWLRGQAVVDAFPSEMPVKDVVKILSSVGFSSPPDWLKPYGALSTGQQFRCDLARTLAMDEELSVVDEFTSVVDRTVARIGSHAVAKTVRRTPGRRLVAVTCHDDVEAWLQPDWVCEPGAGVFRWRSERRRPAIPFRLVRCDRSAWSWFHRHHYLTRALNKSSRCFLGLVDGRPATFSAVLPMPHSRTRRLARLHRTVVLPDFQGVGLSTHVSSLVARICWENGKVLTTRTSHPALVIARARSKVWTMTSKPKFAVAGTTIDPGLRATLATTRRTAAFKWCGGGFDDPQLKEVAKCLWRTGKHVA